MASMADIMARRERQNARAFQGWLAERNRLDAINPPRRERLVTVEELHRRYRARKRRRLES